MRMTQMQTECSMCACGRLFPSVERKVWRAAPRPANPFTYLLQILIHNAQRRDPDRLEEMLFEDRRWEPPPRPPERIYNTKKKLEKAGCPCELHRAAQGRFLYGRDPVEDAREFEALYTQRRRARMWTSVWRCTWTPATVRRGISAHHTGVIWAAREARRYRESSASAWRRPA